MAEAEIIDGLKTVCLCKAIKKKVFQSFIRDGVASLEQIQELTGAGTGECQGKRCTPKIIELLQQSK